MNSFKSGLISCFLAMTSCGFAQEVAEKYGDWELICSDSSIATSPKQQPAELSQMNSCRLAQHHAVVDTNEALLVLNVLKGRQDLPVAIMSVPPGVYLAPGILIRIDQDKPFKLLYETCNGTGCHAGFELKPSVLTAFKRGLKVDVRFFNPQQQPVDVGVSLIGFTKGIEALQARVAAQ